MTHVFLAHLTDEQLDEHHSSVPEEGISKFQIVGLPTFRSLVASAEIVDGFTLTAFALWQSIAPSTHSGANKTIESSLS